jgi:hypothetical protein
VPVVVGEAVERAVEVRLEMGTSVAVSVGMGGSVALLPETGGAAGVAGCCRLQPEMMKIKTSIKSKKVPDAFRLVSIKPSAGRKNTF